MTKESLKVIDLSGSLVALDGVKVEGEGSTLGAVLAQSIAISKTEDPIKMFDWAVKLYAGEKLELDDSDFIKLKKYVTDADMRNLPKAQVLKVLEKL